MTLKTGVMMHRRNKLHFKMYSNSKQLFKIVIIFHNIAVDQINAVQKHKRIF